MEHKASHAPTCAQLIEDQIVLTESLVQHFYELKDELRIACRSALQLGQTRPPHPSTPTQPTDPTRANAPPASLHESHYLELTMKLGNLSSSVAAEQWSVSRGCIQPYSHLDKTPQRRARLEAYEALRESVYPHESLYTSEVVVGVYLWLEWGATQRGTFAVTMQPLRIDLHDYVLAPGGVKLDQLWVASLRERAGRRERLSWDELREDDLAKCEGTERAMMLMQHDFATRNAQLSNQAEHGAQDAVVGSDEGQGE